MQPNTNTNINPNKLSVVRTAEEQPYSPTLSVRERRAYQVAHRIYGENIGQSIVFAGDQGNDLVCQGAIRNRVIDHMARIIMEEFK